MYVRMKGKIMKAWPRACKNCGFKGNMSNDSGSITVFFTSEGHQYCKSCKVSRINNKLKSSHKSVSVGEMHRNVCIVGDNGDDWYG